MEDSPSKRQGTDAAQMQTLALLYNRAQEMSNHILFVGPSESNDFNLTGLCR